MPLGGWGWHSPREPKDWWMTKPNQWALIGWHYADPNLAETPQVHDVTPKGYTDRILKAKGNVVKGKGARSLTTNNLGDSGQGQGNMQDEGIDQPSCGEGMVNNPKARAAKERARCRASTKARARAL